MSVLLPDKIDEFVNLTLDNFKRRNWVDLSLDLTEYEFASRMFANKGKVPEKGGVQLNWKIQHDNTGTARHSEMFDIDQTAVKDLTTEAKQPWSKQTVNFSYDIHEDVFQSDAETIVREVEVREHSMYNDFFELMEEAMWTDPSSDSLSPRPPVGIPHFIQRGDGTTAAGAFEGLDPSGFSSGAGGVSSTTYPNWSNWTWRYTSVNRDDFVERWRTACRKTKFKAPHKFRELGGNVAPSNYCHYTTNRVLQPLERLLEGRNENLGVDLAKYMDAVVFKSAPVVYVPYLEENDSTDPIYSVNWKVMHYFFRKGHHMLRGKPLPRDTQHTVRVVHMDNWGNFCAYNRRLLSRGSEA